MRGMSQNDPKVILIYSTSLMVPEESSSYQCHVSKSTSYQNTELIEDPPISLTNFTFTLNQREDDFSTRRPQ